MRVGSSCSSTTCRCTSAHGHSLRGPVSQRQCLRLGCARRWWRHRQRAARAARRHRPPSKQRCLRCLARGRLRCLLGRRSVWRRLGSSCSSTTCRCTSAHGHSLRGPVSQRHCLRLGCARRWWRLRQRATRAARRPCSPGKQRCLRCLARGRRRCLLGQFCPRRSLSPLPDPPRLRRCGDPSRSRSFCGGFAQRPRRQLGRCPPRRRQRCCPGRSAECRMHSSHCLGLCCHPK